MEVELHIVTGKSNDISIYRYIAITFEHHIISPPIVWDFLYRYISFDSRYVLMPPYPTFDTTLPSLLDVRHPHPPAPRGPSRSCQCPRVLLWSTSRCCRQCAAVTKKRTCQRYVRYEKGRRGTHLFGASHQADECLFHHHGLGDALMPWA